MASLRSTSSHGSRSWALRVATGVSSGVALACRRTKMMRIAWAHDVLRLILMPSDAHAAVLFQVSKVSMSRIPIYFPHFQIASVVRVGNNAVCNHTALHNMHNQLLLALQPRCTQDSHMNEEAEIASADHRPVIWAPINFGHFGHFGPHVTCVRSLSS